MPGLHVKDLNDSIPVLDDQGISNVIASPVPGVGFQFTSYIAGAGADVFVFADNGLEDMEDGSYEAVSWNQTSVARLAIVTLKTAKQFTITGQNALDVMTLIVIGKLQGQLG